MKNRNTRLPQIFAAAAMMMALSAAPAFAAGGWQMEQGQWVYLDRNGNKVTETWKKNAAGDHWYYLKEDGYMAVSQRIDDGEDNYYVNSSGAMVKNEWRLLEDDSDNGAYPDGNCWYYFNGSGKAVKNTSGKTKLTTINGKKYAFDEEGKMLYGWVSEDGTMLMEDDGWTEGVYYFGAPEDGAAVINGWKRIEVDDPEGDSEADGNYWFYFGSNGKKAVNTTKTLDKAKYQFDERGVAQFKWTPALSAAASASNASPSNYKYHNNPDECWQRTNDWVYAVPTEEIDPQAYADDEEFWFYIGKNGKLAVSQIKTINNYKYAFNEKGEMLEGLYILAFDEKKNIVSYEKIEDIADMPGEDEDVSVYYFGNSPKDGVMATKKNVEVELEDKYTFGFRSNGEGIHGISDNAIYIRGRKLKADSELKLQPVTFEGQEYLINSSGTIQKKKTNVKDSDDTYYCTNDKGIITYSGSEKQTK